MTEPVRAAEPQVDLAATADPAATPAVEAAAQAPVPDTLGRMLARERERLGLSLGDVASRLRLHPRQLAAMEADRFDALPKGPFLRGFVRNYAKQLRLDPGPLLAQLERQVGSTFETSERAEIGGGSLGALNRDRVSRAVVIGGAIGALAVFAVIGWVVSRPAAGPPTARLAVGAPAVEASPDARGTESQAPADATAAVPVSRAADEKSAAPATPAAATPAPAPASKSAPAGALAIRLVFGERPSWVEVTQGDGRVLYSGMNEPGSERRIVGQPPLRVVVGNASGVRIEARGRDIDLAPFVRADDLARLTLE